MVIMSTNNIQSEFDDHVENNKWLATFQRLGRQCLTYDYTCAEAKKPQNKVLNRYRNVDPYDHSRVVLIRSPVDYINANHVRMERANRRYILTQGPLANTVEHFWLMIWEQNSKAILMLSKIIEKNETKCHCYWPKDVGPEHKLDLTKVGLTVEQIRTTNYKFYVTRLFRLCDVENNETREVIQFHYTTWPDFSVPSSPVAFLDFLKQVRESGALEEDVGPAIVHCSAGIGRSGTFCLVDSCLVLIEKEGINSVNVQNILLEMRKDRMGLIQTPDQLRFSYEAIIEGAKRLDSNYTPQMESIYDDPHCDQVTPEDSDEPPPLPPPRLTSLNARPPARPLPAIPTSTSVDELRRELPPVPSISESDASEASSPDISDVEYEPDNLDKSDEAEDMASGEGDSSVRFRSVSEQRQRRTQDLAARVAGMKRRQQDAERWNTIKRLKQEKKQPKRKN